MLFQKEKIEVIAGHRGCLAAFPSEHLLLAVRGSCGRLSMDWFEPEKEARGCEADYRSILYLGETPLLRIQANGSPTCESMLAAGKFVRSGLHWISHMPDLRMRWSG